MRCSCDTKELCQVQQYESGHRAAEFDSSCKNKQKFSVLEKSNTMEMATMAVMGIDPQNVSKLSCLWLYRTVAKRLKKQKQNMNISVIGY